MHVQLCKSISLTTAILFAVATGDTCAETMSFLVDPDSIDGDMDGFISGAEFSPIGSDGTTFAMTPTGNLVGFDRFHLRATTGLRFGGGGGSALTFDFSVDRDIELNAYTLGTSFSFLGNPVFDIREGANAMSSSNTAIASGETHDFEVGPLSLQSGTTYSFVAVSFGATVQSFLESWDYTPVPEPMSCLPLWTAGLLLCSRRRLRS